MKNTLFKYTIVLLLLSSLIPYACAQNRIDLPYYFCAMNGTCFNQPPIWYVRVEDEEFSNAEATYITELFQMTHPEYTIIESASKLYNCHGYAYSVYQGGERLIIEWKDYLCSYNGSTIALAIGRCLQRTNAFIDYQGTTLHEFLQSGRLTNVSDLDYIYSKIANQ